MAVAHASWDAILAFAFPSENADFHSRAYRGAGTFAVANVDAAASAVAGTSWGNDDSMTFACLDLDAENIVMSSRACSLGGCWGTVAASCAAADADGASETATAVDIDARVLARMLAAAHCSLWTVDAKMLVVLVILTGPANCD